MNRVPGAGAPEYMRMALRPYQPPGPPHEFDIVAYDGHDKPVLVVEVKRNGDIRQFKQIVRDAE